MRIGINCRSFLKKQYAGIGRYAYHLVKCLSEIDQKNEYLLYAQKKFFDAKRKIPQIKAKNFSVRIDRFNQGIEKTLGKIDIYHAPSPEFLNIKNAKTVVSVHDIIFRTYPQGHTQKTRETLEKQLKEIVERASRIICCSQSTINDIKKHYGLGEEKIRLIYPGVDRDIFYPLEDKDNQSARAFIKSKGVEGQYLLFIGTIEPRKNLHNLLRAYVNLKKRKRFEGHLVVIGMKGWLVDGLEAFIEELGVEKEVILLGYTSNRELRYFYNLAEVFVFPSFYEGFGFPLLEAFSCGAAVVTSNVSSCPEIASDAALTVAPDRPEEIADAIEQIIHNQDLKKNLQQKAFKRALDFSFINTAKRTIKVYEEVFNL